MKHNVISRVDEIVVLMQRHSNVEEKLSMLLILQLDVFLADGTHLLIAIAHFKYRPLPMSGHAWYRIVYPPAQCIQS
jgi:hypothetical protein